MPPVAASAAGAGARLSAMADNVVQASTAAGVFFMMRNVIDHVSSSEPAGCATRACGDPSEILFLSVGKRPCYSAAR